MTDYYWGLLVGAGIGYCIALATLMMMWALCVIAKTEEGQANEYQTDVEKKQH